LNRSSLNSPPYWPSIRTTAETPDILMRALDGLITAIGAVKTSESTGV
jgi:hypothetical protein